VSTMKRSTKLFEQTRGLIAGGVNSNIRLGEEPQPLFLAKAKGAIVEDVDGNAYIDYICGYGPIILGHCDPQITEVVIRALHEGQLYGGQHAYEVATAELIHRAVPAMEVMRFASSGSEVVHGAIRVARAATGRWTVVRFDGHYHGWLDTIYTADRRPDDPPVAPARPGSAGQPPSAVQEVVVLPWNDPGAIEAAFSQCHGRLAAVILEPLLCNTGVIPARPGYLKAIRQWCDRENAVLIFDEVITGFRVAWGGIHAQLGVKPDLVVLGKAVANGFPLSVFGGRRDLMDVVGSRKALHGGTFNGNVVSTAAAQATLEALGADGGQRYRSLTATGQSLMEGIRKAAREAGVPVLVQGPGPVFFMGLTDRVTIEDPTTAVAVMDGRYRLFTQSMRRRGIRLLHDGRWYLNMAHTPDHIEQTVLAVKGALRDVAAPAVR
jgi:glutamate-1-semialdehyde 2,1-aminomutase